VSFQRPLQLPGKINADDDDAVAACGGDLRRGCLAAYEVDALDTGELGELDDVLADGGIRACLSDPVARRQLLVRRRSRSAVSGLTPIIASCNASASSLTATNLSAATTAWSAHVPCS
jgi:hypothetical protein